MLSPESGLGGRWALLRNCCGRRPAGPPRGRGVGAGAALAWRMATSLRSRFERYVVPLLDPLLVPVTTAAARHLKALRRLDLRSLPRNREALARVGIWPVRDHYYEPLIDPRHLREPLDAVRDLPGLDLREDAQLALLAALRYGDELRALPTGSRPGEFRWDNGTYFWYDAQFLYSIVRHTRPKRILEIGSGNSTLVVRHALAANRAADPAATCVHTCVEPYEMPWLERCGAEVVRARVETLDPSYFAALDAGDILFVDSSHMVRPQGDVLFEILQILPRLRPGVLVHVHDIFTPRDYPHSWVFDKHLFWNEQYVLEAFLSMNDAFEVVAALHHLAVSHPDALKAALPLAPTTGETRPSGFWFRRRG